MLPLRTISQILEDLPQQQQQQKTELPAHLNYRPPPPPPPEFSSSFSSSSSSRASRQTRKPTENRRCEDKRRRVVVEEEQLFSFFPDDIILEIWRKCNGPTLVKFVATCKRALLLYAPVEQHLFVSLSNQYYWWWNTSFDLSQCSQYSCSNYFKHRFSFERQTQRSKNSGEFWYYKKIKYPTVEIISYAYRDAREQVSVLFSRFFPKQFKVIGKDEHAKVTSLDGTLKIGSFFVPGGLNYVVNRPLVERIGKEIGMTSEDTIALFFNAIGISRVPLQSKIIDEVYVRLMARIFDLDAQ